MCKGPMLLFRQATYIHYTYCATKKLSPTASTPPPLKIHFRLQNIWNSLRGGGLGEMNSDKSLQIWVWPPALGSLRWLRYARRQKPAGLSHTDFYLSHPENKIILCWDYSGTNISIKILFIALKYQHNEIQTCGKNPLYSVKTLKNNVQNQVKL